MLSFSKYLKENYKNFIGPSSIESRRRWADQVWDILQKSYANIGGIKGKGFETKEDMIQKIPFWKIYTKNDRVVAAAFYKDKGGRKSVAIATDGSDLGSKIVDDIFKSSLGVSYGEKSKKALGKMMKSVEWDILKNFLIKPEHVEELSGERIINVEDFGPENLDKDDLFTYNKYPQLRPYMYVLNLGGKMILKVAMGTPSIKIFG